MNRKILVTGGSGFIGTNIIELLLSKGYNSIINFDKAEPLKKSHNRFWKVGNIMDKDAFNDAVASYQPDVVMHLAARTDTLSDRLEDYDENITGTQNVIDGVMSCDSVKRFIVTSTQYVYKSEAQPFPLDNDSYDPHTVYGQSKVLTEKYTKSAALNCEWVIVRPTNIWGPWHMRYPLELWKMIDNGMYVHPGNFPVIRTYGYVGNVAYQYYKIMIADSNLVDRETFYVGDAPVDSYSWLNELSLQLTGKKVRRIPALIFRIGAYIGDFLQLFKVSFPLYSKRFRNMVEDYPAPTESTIRLFGVAQDSMAENVKETISWLKGEGKPLLDYWKDKR